MRAVIMLIAVLPGYVQVAAAGDAAAGESRAKGGAGCPNFVRVG